jgi:hypothetical protein
MRLVASVYENAILDPGMYSLRFQKYSLLHSAIHDAMEALSSFN